MKRHQWAYLQGWISIVINSVLFGFKIWAGVVSGSVAVIADAWHTLSDSATSVVVLVGAATSRKPADEQHPFGHGRAETIAAIIIGILLGMVGLNFVVEAVNRFNHHQQANYGSLVLIVFAASVLVKEGLAQFSFIAGKKTANPSLKADGWHHRSDAVASLLILVGAVAGQRFWWIDSVLGLFVALLIIYAAYQIAREAITLLMGEKPSAEIKRKIRRIVHETTGHDSAHHLHIHTYGDHKEVTMHLQLNPEMKLQEVHGVVERVEQRVLEEVGLVATIHVDPTGVNEKVSGARVKPRNGNVRPAGQMDYAEKRV